MRNIFKAALPVLAVSAISGQALAVTSEDVRASEVSVVALEAQLASMGIEVDSNVQYNHSTSNSIKERRLQAKHAELQEIFNRSHF